MAQQTINVGTAPNDGTGTPLRTAFQYTNSNFTELYTATGPSGNNIAVPGNATITGDLTVDTNTLKVDSANNRVGIKQASPSHPFQIGTTDLILDASSNLGLGVTPSAWDAGLSAFEMKSGSILGFAGSVANFTSNAYYQGAWKYKTSAAAAYYQQANGSHSWQIAASGTAGNAITFTQAMTLTSGGDLLVGTTTAGIGGSANTRFTVKGNSDTYFSLSASGGEEMIAACQAGVVKIGSFNNNRFELLQNNNTKVTIDTSGNFIPLLTATAPSLGTNSQMVFNLTSNTNLRISVRGTDGTTRTANITLA